MASFPGAFFPVPLSEPNPTISGATATAGVILAVPMEDVGIAAVAVPQAARANTDNPASTTVWNFLNDCT
ncbi:hypothetical protein [Cryobacterium sp. MLB-32]|uniref:hypothetical protein n=1 Tax=Cryobacterium sp. MLB-32 TaxID=1529318 RepID=UPI0018CEA037|nr:hypothetical protein [Cryobacterium sp. MLB-32]